jgi:hypothetical protein
MPFDSKQFQKVRLLNFCFRADLLFLCVRECRHGFAHYFSYPVLTGTWAAFCLRCPRRTGRSIATWLKAKHGARKTKHETRNPPRCQANFGNPVPNLAEHETHPTGGPRKASAPPYGGFIGPGLLPVGTAGRSFTNVCKGSVGTRNVIRHMVYEWRLRVVVL